MKFASFPLHCDKRDIKLVRWSEILTGTRSVIQSHSIRANGFQSDQFLSLYLAASLLNYLLRCQHYNMQTIQFSDTDTYVDNIV